MEKKRSQRNEYMGCFVNAILHKCCQTDKKQPREMDRKSKKILTINKNLHPKSDIGRRYVPKNEGRRRGHIECEISVVNEEIILRWHIKEQLESLLAAVRNNTYLKYIALKGSR